MLELALKYGAWVLSIMAMAQFWIWLYLRRSKGRISLEMYESGTVEIGFDANGPIIGMAGVLRAGSQDIFVRSMELTVTSNRDKTRYDFRWLAFKPNFLLPAAGTKALEMPHPFMVMPGEPGKFNVVFHDVMAFPQVKGILQQYSHQWHEVERKILERRSLKLGLGDLADHADLIGEFKKQDVCVNSYTELNRMCFWEQGNYTLTLKVITEGGKADVSGTFGFTLGKQDAKMLKTNCVTMLDEPIAALIGNPNLQCRAVQVEYAKPELIKRT